VPLFIEIIASLVLIVALFGFFRFAMGLRYAKILREQALQRESSRGRRVIAEVPTPEGTIELFREDDAEFYWSGDRISKRGLSGVRLVLNGAVMAQVQIPDAVLPVAPVPEEFEGRERWEVVAYHATSDPTLIACGNLREGVSRDAARAVYDALKSACEAEVADASGGSP